jgi:hypothetical protein
MSLFDKEFINSMKKTMTSEQILEYEKVGKNMYGHHFDTPETDTKNVAEYLAESVNSGLHPSQLNEVEKELMEISFGKTWYLKYGYVEKDLTEFFTI